LPDPIFRRIRGQFIAPLSLVVAGTPFSVLPVHANKIPAGEHSGRGADRDIIQILYGNLAAAIVIYN